MNDIYKSTDGARLVHRRYRELLSRWPVPSQQLRVPTRQGETFVVTCGPGAGTGASAPARLGREHGHVDARHRRVGRPLSDLCRRPDRRAGPERAIPPAAGLGRVRVVVGRRDAATRAHPRFDGGGFARRVAGPGLRHPATGTGAAAGPAQSEWDRSAAAGHPGQGGVAEPARRLGTAPSARFCSWSRPGRADHTGPGARRVRVADRQALQARMQAVPRLGDDALARLTMPVLAIVGGRDAMLDSHETRRRLAHAVPGATVRLPPDAGHLVPGQTAAVLEFLRTTSDPGIAA